MEGLEDVKKELEAKRQQLALELESARGTIAAIENDLRRVDDALSALTKKKSKKSARPRAPALPAASVEEIRRHLASVRAELPFARGAELEDAVRARIRESGASLAGFESLYPQALSGASPFDESQRFHG